MPSRSPRPAVPRGAVPSLGNLDAGSLTACRRLPLGVQVLGVLARRAHVTATRAATTGCGHAAARPCAVVVRVGPDALF